MAVGQWFVDLEYVTEWMSSLDEATYTQVMAAAELLAFHGPHLGRP